MQLKSKQPTADFWALYDNENWLGIAYIVKGEQSVDFVTTAQAFHWFDGALFRRECKRILKKNGLVFLIRI